uniref:Uncharacterized protein n=1 Tax=Arundo donax TaxID=35708 RepID=A0A0A9ECV9_ARUDO
MAGVLQSQAPDICFNGSISTDEAMPFLSCTLVTQ